MALNTASAIVGIEQPTTSFKAVVGCFHFDTNQIMAASEKIIRSELVPGITALPSKQYVSGGVLLTGNMLGPRVLPEPIDEVERAVGGRVYDRMITDPDVQAGISVLVLSALAEGIQFSPNIKDDQTEGHDESVRWAAFVTRAFCRVPQMRAKLETIITEGLSHGNKVAEWLLEYPADGEDKGALTLRDMKPKPREVVGFVVNEYADLLGLTAVKPGQSYSTFQGSQVQADQILPLEKFFIFTPVPRNNDPRGVSYIRAAYEAWWLKQQTFPEFLRFLLQCAIESLLGFLPPDAEDVEAIDPLTGQPEIDPLTDRPRTIPAAMDMLQNLISIRNAQAAVFANEAKVQAVEVHSDGEVFHKAFQFYGKQITLAILKQELATRDAQHQTKGSQQGQQTILDLVVVSLKGIICDTLRNGIVRTLIRMNGGDAAAAAYLPEVTAGSERRDWATDADAASALAPYLTDSQWIQITTELGFKVPEEGEVLPTRVKATVKPAGAGNDPDADEEGDQNAK